MIIFENQNMAAEEHVENGETSEKTLKRKREPSVLDNFTKLVNPQEKIRIKSGTDLLRYLTISEDSEKGNDELHYALGRLIRGLGSSNIHAKSGFFSALVGIFNLNDISVEKILEIVSKELHKGGNNAKSENADISSGQILLAGAIMRSDLYINCEDKEKIKVLELLINAGKERTYLNLASHTFLTDLYSKIDSEEFERLVFPLVKGELSKPWQEQDLDSLYLLLETKKTFPQATKSKFLRNNLGTSEILCSESIPQLCNVLINIPRVTALKHPVFDIFVEKLSDSAFILEFFETLDQTISKFNRNKYLVVTKLLTETLRKIKDNAVIPQILTKNYIQQTINTYKTAVGKLKDKEFQQSTQKLFEVLLNNLKNEGVKSKIKLRVLKKLLFYPGTFIFEKVTKSKLVQNITATLDTDGVKKLGSIYYDVILATYDRVIDENTTEKWWNMDRVYASHLLVKLLNHPSMHEENEWKIEQMVFLMKIGLLRGNENIGQDLADSLKETFYSSLDLKLSKLNDLRFILSKIVDNLSETVSEDNFESILRHPISKEDYETWCHTVELAKKIETKTKKKYLVFHILFLHLGLQIFNNSKLASDSLKELFSCYERVKKSKKTETEADSEDPYWIEVVVDLFLNLLSHNSHLLRNIINCVFPHLCKYMTNSSVHQILSVLDPKSEVNPLSQSDDDEDDENEDESTDDDESVSEEDEEEEDEEENVNDKLRMALQQALGVNASDAESVDLDEIDDEEGERLDQVLGQAFKQFRPNLGKTKKQSKDEETLMHFRVRVLDLIEIYLNSNPSMLLTLEIMLPLLQILEFSIRDDHQKPLQDRVRACLKKLTSLKKFTDYEDLSEEILVELLKSLLDKGSKNAIIIQDMGEKIAECCGFIINCSISVNTLKEAKPKISVQDVIKDSLEAFFNKRDCLIPYVLFKNVIQMNWEGILDLIPSLTGFVFSKNVRPFRKNQALELLRLFYTNNRFLQSHSEQIKCVEQTTVNFLMESLEFFKEVNDSAGERKIKEKFICSLFLLLSSIKACVLSSSFNNWDAVGDAVRDCRSQMTLSKDTKMAFNKLCKSLNISNIVKMKLNNKKVKDGNEEVDQAAPKEEKKKRKKKHLSKDQLKMKKESKQLRLQSLSEGIRKRKVLEDEDLDTLNKRIKAS